MDPQTTLNSESHSKSEKPKVVLPDLFPHLDEEQLKEAEENLDRYLKLALRIYERIRTDPDAYTWFEALTGSSSNATIGDTRSKPS